MGRPTPDLHDIAAHIPHARCAAPAAGLGMELEAEIDPNLIAWQKSFHDERIRDSYQSAATLAYVRNNALNHGLVNDPLAWPWSSLRFPELTNAIEPWLD